VREMRKKNKKDGVLIEEAKVIRRRRFEHGNR
jgi:hypothetical protein